MFLSSKACVADGAAKTSISAMLLRVLVVLVPVLAGVEGPATTTLARVTALI